MKTKTKTIVITILAILTVIPLFAQNDISSVLDSIEGNNTTLTHCVKPLTHRS